MLVSPDTTVATIAVTFPESTRVFERYGIDYCCGGHRPISEVCAEHGLELTRLLESIEREKPSPSAQERHWDQEPLDALIVHILNTYHRPLDSELPRLQQLAAKVHSVHGSKDPERLTEIVTVFAALKAELADHFAKEEKILFPMILSGRGAETGGPISVMEHEHESAGNALRRLRELTNDYTVPAEACNSWRALWEGLAALEQSLHVHIHLENNILFPRALRS